MRFLGKFSDPSKAEKFAKYLTSQGVGNSLEKIVNTDWGSDEYGSQVAAVWIVDEDQVAKAQELFEKFHLNPDDIIPPEDAVETIAATAIAQHPLTTQSRNTSTSSKAQTKPATQKPSALSEKKDRNKTGPITLYIIFFCTLLFAFIDWQSPQLKKVTEGLPLTPVLSSPLRKELLFDYPQAYTYIDKIVTLYGPDKYDTVQQLPMEGQVLYQKFENTPIWQGLYYYTLEWLNPPKTKTPIGNVMEKIREGELWRTITPSLMHGDIFHLIFNMFGLLILGKMMELRLSKSKYLIFMLITGLITNFAQYFMSGPNFIGYSGILCAMIGFIWMRQRVAAWEGYPLQSQTFSFTFFFVMAIFAAQTVAFIFEAANIGSLPINIANTAHVVGGISGLLLGRLPFFECKFKGI